MKKSVLFLALSIGSLSHAYADKIQDFLSKQTNQISTDFPYRINLYEQGQVDKNNAGIRIAEQAKQFAKDDSGLIFYYQLYNHSMRVPHWHANAVETGTVLSGKMRVTIWEGKGKTHVFTVNPNSTWMIPQASLHALENVGKDKLSFLVTYNSPITADRDFVTAWAALPDDILARAVGLSTDEISVIRKSSLTRLANFDAAANIETGDQLSPFSTNFDTIKPIYQSSLGTIKRVDGDVNEKMKAMSLQQTILKPGTLRLPHWYTAGDSLFFVYQGSGFFTMMTDDGKVYQATVKPGDLISLPVGTFHGYLNTGKDDLIIYESFNVAKDIQEISLLDGAQRFSTGVVQGATGLSKATTERISKQQALNYMVAF